MATKYVELTKHAWMHADAEPDPPLLTCARLVKDALESQSKKDAAKAFDGAFMKIYGDGPGEDQDLSQAQQQQLMSLLLSHQGAIVHNLMHTEELTARQVAEGKDLAE